MELQGQICLSICVQPVQHIQGSEQQQSAMVGPDQLRGGSHPIPQLLEVLGSIRTTPRQQQAGEGSSQPSCTDPAPGAGDKTPKASRSSPNWNWRDTGRFRPGMGKGGGVG